ncbi:MAG: inositol monophosphatase family protein [Candidatus Woesearchaeota archaeon]
MSEELQTAIQACKKAGKVLLEHFTQELVFTDKGNHDLVSEADLASEKAILSVIQEKFPEDAFFTEKSSFIGKSENVWVIDPLDGTANFSLELPQFAISIALVKNGKPILGVVYHPFLDKMVYAEEGQGAFLNHQKLFLSSNNNKTIALNVGYPSQHLDLEIFSKLRNQVKRILTHWSPAFDFVLLATGKIESIISMESEVHDQIAGLVIAKELGLIIKRVDGEEFSFQGLPKYYPSLVISQNEEQCNWLIEKIKE